jgi:hypothetical protein
MKEKNSVGRPPKFLGERRPVTVTLPETALARLAAINPDRALAIVKAVNLATETWPASGGILLETIEVMRHQTLIVVGRSRALESISWLELAEISPGRHLLVVPSGTSYETLELAVVDAVEHGIGREDEREREFLSRLRGILRSARHDKRARKAEIRIADASR